MEDYIEYMKKYPILFLLMFVFAARPVFAGTLSCSVTDVTSCSSSSGIVIYRMSGNENAHAELPSQSNSHYAGNVVCCTGVTGLGNDCVNPPNAVVLKLSGSTGSNAQVQENTGNDYQNNACISVPSGSTISVGYATGTAGTTGTTCADALFDTTLGSISSSTNAHVGGPDVYARKICASGTNSPPVSGTLTSSVFDTGITSGSIGYNSIMWKGALGGPGLNQGKVSFQLAAASDPAGDYGGWQFYGGSTCGSQDWFDSIGPDQPIELKGSSCVTNWNNKRYFRYKVKICSSGDCQPPGIYPSPRVDSIIVNWSP